MKLAPTPLTRPVATRTVTYIYDGLGRRVERIDSVSGGATTGTRFVYDGWRVVEETDQNGTVLHAYTRGLDLSGTPEGAGGIGGLLAIATPSDGAWTAASYAYDGNGNVTDLFNDNGTSAAHYTYGPFGERLTATGALADVNTVQFSSKERDAFTGFYYYGQRYYNPSTGRWLSRDPIQEQGGVNLYGMVGNNPINFWDYLGFIDQCDCKKIKDKLETRKRIADYQFVHLYGPEIDIRDARPNISDLSGAIGTAAGIADAMFSNAGYKGSAIGIIGAVTFVIPYVDSVKNAINAGSNGTSASYTNALGEVIRQGVVYTGGAWIGEQMVKTPTPLTIGGGLIIIGTSVLVDASNRYQDDKFSEDQRLANSLQLNTNRRNFLNGVDRLNNDINIYNRDCGGRA